MVLNCVYASSRVGRLDKFFPFFDMSNIFYFFLSHSYIHDRLPKVESDTRNAAKYCLGRQNGWRYIQSSFPLFFSLVVVKCTARRRCATANKLKKWKGWLCIYYQSSSSPPFSILLFLLSSFTFYSLSLSFIHSKSTLPTCFPFSSFHNHLNTSHLPPQIPHHTLISPVSLPAMKLIVTFLATIAVANAYTCPSSPAINAACRDISVFPRKCS